MNVNGTVVKPIEMHRKACSVKNESVLALTILRPLKNTRIIYQKNQKQRGKS